MSLFPAYSAAKENDNASSENEAVEGSKKVLVSEWPPNKSFALGDAQIKNAFENDQDKASFPTGHVSDSDSADGHSSMEFIGDALKQQRHQFKVVNNKASSLEFNNSEEFYVDKKPQISYRAVNTLHKPTRPRYNVRLIKLYAIGKRNKFILDNKYLKTRYFKNISPDKCSNGKELSELERNKLSARIGELNSLVANRPDELNHWLELIELNKLNVNKLNRLQMAQKQLHLLTRGLVHHRSCEPLLRLYIEVANSNFPSNEVSAMLETLLENDPYNYTLWTAQIMATQGTMARCNIPEVLRIYERCMQRMHRAQNQHIAGSDCVDTDPIMLKLFHNCALLLRQAGNNEKFFALLRLALELNVPGIKVDNFNPVAEGERTLVDFEELILESGLPLSEIWLRIEKLRQCFIFLPLPQIYAHEYVADASKDPLRTIFNEDICHYIYPLKSTTNRLQLMLLIVQLTKLPFVTSHGLAQRLSARIEQIGDSDAIEMVLAPAGQRSTYALDNQLENEYINILYTMANEMSISPTFISKSLGHEFYVSFISKLLMNCAEVFTNSSDLLKRRIFLLLWFRFERMRLVLEKINGKFEPNYARLGRQRIKAVLKQCTNNEQTAYFTELALYKYETYGQVNENESPFEIFKKIIEANKDLDSNFLSHDLWYAYVIYAELLISQKQHENAINILTCLALSRHATEYMQPTNRASILIAIERLQQRVEAAIEEERPHLQCNNATYEMPLEYYFIKHNSLILLRARCLLQCMLGQRDQAMAYLDELLNDRFPKSNPNEFNRHMREQIYELCVLVLQLPSIEPTSIDNMHSLLAPKLSDALTEFPRNMHLLQRWCMLTILPWYKIRARLFSIDANILTIIYLIATTRYRFLKIDDIANDRESSNMIYNRLLNVFNTLAPNNKQRSDSEIKMYEYLKRNALYWRFQLRCLSLNEHTSFDVTKQCLLTALDECPWNKSLYMDGAKHVPQEVAHMQDLMAEKQLRIYALPEELEILRGR